MRHYQYYEGVFSSDQEIDSNDRWLVVCIEAASYCESYGLNHINFYQLKLKCSGVIERYTKGRSVLSSGSLDSILKSDRRKGLLRVRRKVGPKKDETRIYPNIPYIQRVVQGRKLENLAKGSELFCNRRPNEIVTKIRSPTGESVVVAEGIDRIVTKVRAPPAESVVVTEGIGVVVTRASKV